MLLPTFKKLRVVLSLIFFLATAFVLVDFLSLLPPIVVRSVLFLQFTPSLVSFFTVASTATIGFAVVLVLTLLFGRIYCSTICPIGTLQDLVAFISRKLRTKKYLEPLDRHTNIHMAFLVVAALPVAIGSMFAVNLLDPFSNFGRLSGSLIRPLIIVANNALASGLELFNRFDLFPVEVKSVAVASIILPLLFFALVGWMSFQHGRLYCNSICPVGALLRLVTRYSVFKIAIDADHCKSCQLCQRVCKAGCIDRKSKTVEFERCVLCFNCLSACPSGGLKFISSLRSPSLHQQVVDGGRRSFLLGTPLLFLGRKLAADTTKIVKPQKDSTIPERKLHPVTPPGSLGIHHFTQTCTACHVCISSCPSQVIQPSFLQYGLAGLLQPVMDFDASYCNFECTVCTEICPSGALRKMTAGEKKLNQAGRVVFIKENCVVYTENTDCGACTEHCPTKAVVMVPYKNSRLPEVKPEYCIGCGACEHACPPRPYRAIYVDGNPVHLIAKKKEPEKKQEVDLKADFPF
jgi:ferredoxin